MMRFPKDCSARAICTRARSIVPYRLDSEVFDWQELTGTDHGTDMVIEYVEEGIFRNYKLECQIKGTTEPNFLRNGDLSFALDIKTIGYALGCPRSFILLLVDVNREDVYYLPLQHYFIENKDG